MAFELKKLNDVCRLINGRAYKKPEMLAEGKYPLLRVGNFFSNRAWYFSDLELNEDKYCNNGDLLYAWSASFGPRIWDGGKVIYHYHIWKIEINEELVNKGYLFHLLDWDTEQIKAEQGTGSTMIHVTKGSMENRYLPFPTIPEQKRIVAILDQAFADIEQARAKTEQNLKNARELFESYLQQVFSQRGEDWVESTLGDATGGIYTGPFGSLLHKSDYIENGIPLVNPVHITVTGIEPDYRKTVSKETVERLSNYIMHEDDIIIARRGEMGRCALVSSSEEGFLCGTGSFFIKPSSKCDSGYLVRYLRSASCVFRLEKIAGGAVMPNLSNKDLSNLEILLPPIEKQIEILELIDILSAETGKVAETYQKKLEALDELKKSILQKAFSGELTKKLEVDTNKGAVA
ncbi:MAG: type I restriction enzyme S subunit [Alteromonas macleodii]|jgi:type I restriction enzyme S subunit